MIPKIRRILYCTDLSKNSAYAFRYAINTAQKHDADIYILYVIEEIPEYFRTMLERYANNKRLHDAEKQRIVDLISHKNNDGAYGQTID